MDCHGAIYIPFAQAVPKVAVITPDFCNMLKSGKCGVCSKVCGAGAIDYKQKENIIKLILSAICMCLAYFTKMNYVIVIIAIIIYLGLYLIQEKEKKQICKSIINILIYALIAIVPFNLVKSSLTVSLPAPSNIVPAPFGLGVKLLNTFVAKMTLF